MSAIPIGWIKQPDGSYSPPKRNALEQQWDKFYDEKQVERAAEKRIRQNTKPLMNKLETEFLNVLLADFIHLEIHAQAITFKLANGLRYTPDFFNFHRRTAWEVKGKWVDGDSFPKLKMAASVFPEISWRLVWKDENKKWQQQIILK
jgi:hypothetical protein